MPDQTPTAVDGREVLAGMQPLGGQGDIEVRQPVSPPETQEQVGVDLYVGMGRVVAANLDHGTRPEGGRAVEDRIAEQERPADGAV
jgi:hypothetical protein